jgi:hypothetical protein
LKPFGQPLPRGRQTATAAASFSLRRSPGAACAQCQDRLPGGLLAFGAESPLCLACLPLPEALELALAARLDLAARSWYERWKAGAPMVRLRGEIGSFAQSLEAAFADRGHAAPREMPETPPRRPYGLAGLGDPYSYRICLPPKGETCGFCAACLASPLVGGQGSRPICPPCLAIHAPSLGHLLASATSARAYGALLLRRTAKTRFPFAQLARQILVYGALLERRGQPGHQVLIRSEEPPR